MSDTTTRPARPVAPAPIAQNIPAELRERPQWIVWRYELRRDKWTKVPYVPGTTRKASSTRPASWRSFAQALACYEERPDYFDGIGYVFAADDPYVGGDFDNCLDAGQLSAFASAHLPPTYAEISPSGTGIKFIARAAGTYGRKTSRGELYSAGRFFTITGRVVPGHTTITSQQQAVDALLAALGPAEQRSARAWQANSSRAAAASAISDAEWQEARKLYAQADRLVERARKAAREETQLGLVLGGQYEEFNNRWPFVGLYRADGTLDSSQVRSVVAFGLAGRGFTFAEYVVIMTRLFGRAKPTKQLWQQELVALWNKAPKPARPYTPQQRYTVAKSPRGRAGNHNELVERVYRLLLDYRAGTEALVKTTELADSLNVDRRTVAKILGELRSSGRIETRRAGRYAGLVVSFVSASDSQNPDVIYSQTTTETPAEQPANAIISDVIYSATLQRDTAEQDAVNVAEPAAPIEETSTKPDPCVSSTSAPITSDNRQSLAELVAEAIACYGTAPGRIKPLERCQRYIADNAPGRWSAAAVEREYKAQIERNAWSRRDQRVAEKARALGLAALRKKSQAIASQAVDMRRRGDKRYPIWERLALIYAAEEARRADVAAIMDQQMFGELGACEREQREMLDLVDDALGRVTPPPRPLPAPEPAPGAPSAAGLIARLKARQEALNAAID